MSAFSASDAALEGFQVLRRHWHVAIGWCLFSVIGFAVSVVAAFFAILFATFAVSSRDQADALGAAIGGLVFGAGAIGTWVMEVAALYRLILRPEEPPGLYYLRISKAEGRLFALGVILSLAAAVLFVGGYVAISTLMRLIGGLGFFVGLVLFAAFSAFFLVKTSLAGPANLAEGSLGLRASWTLTRGNFWPIFGAGVIAFCLLLLVFVVVWIVTFVIQAAIGGFHSFAPVSLSDPQALAERPGAYVFGMLAELALGPVYWVIAAAPFAAIYRQLAAREA